MFFLEAVQASPEWFEYLKPALEVVIPVLATAIAGFLTILFNKLLKRWEAKTGMEMDEKHQEKIRQSILAGIALGEQTALKAVKLGEEAPDGARKMKIAIEYVRDTLKEMGYSQIPEEQIEKWVEILLAQTLQPLAVDAKTEAEVNILNRISSIPLPPAGSQFFLNGNNKPS